MKQIKSANGEVELQTPEYALRGPVRTASGNPLADAIRRITVLEEQVASLQLAMPRELPKP